MPAKQTRWQIDPITSPETVCSRKIQFSLSSVLAVVTVCCAGFALLIAIAKFHAQLSHTVAWIVTISAVLFLGSLILIPIVIIRLPSDHFMKPSESAESWKLRRPMLHFLLQVTKNVIGLIVAIAGLIMVFTPGQGVLAILLGVSLMDIPGKRAIEISVLRRPTILGVINRMRARAGQPPLLLPHGNRIRK